MKQFIATFVVQVPDHEGINEALVQAERYLNTGGRCVDCQVSAIPDDEFARELAHLLPAAAPNIARE